MDSGALTILEYCFLALVYLFLFRVVRTVLAELKPGRIPVPAAAVAEAAPVAAMAPSRKRAQRPALGARDRRAHRAGPARRSRSARSCRSGRGAGCAVVLADDTFVSTVHARIFMRGSDPYVEDLGSTNGTLLNGETVVEPIRLRPGDRVQFGQTVMELVK